MVSRFQCSGVVRFVWQGTTSAGKTTKKEKEKIKKVKITCKERKMIMKPPRLSLLLLSVSLLAPNAVRGAALVFDDTSPNETITIFANDFEFGLSINGQPFQQGLNNPASGTFPETGPISFSGSWIDLGQTQPGSRTIYL